VAGTVAQEAATPIGVEVVDTADGGRVLDPGTIPGLAVTMEANGQRLRLADDGQGGDVAGDELLSTSGHSTVRAAASIETHASMC